MQIASASYWGFVDKRGQGERWWIFVNGGRRLKIQFNHFYIRCDLRKFTIVFTLDHRRTSRYSFHFHYMVYRGLSNYQYNMHFMFS